MNQNTLGFTEDGEEFPLSKEDQKRHMHIIGASGSGKSKFMELLLRRDLHNRNVGACLIDPHGLLVNDLLKYASETQPHLARRIIYFNPARQTDQVLGFSPIPTVDVTPHSAAIELRSKCMRAWNQTDESLQPRIRRWLYNIFYPIVYLNLTLVEASPLVNGNDLEMIRRIIEKIDHPTVREDWEKFLIAGHKDRQMIMEGAENRIQRFLLSEEMRIIFSQKSRSLDFSKIVEEKKILLVDLSGSGKVHEEDMKLIGVLLLDEMFRVGMLRNEDDPRIPFFNLYIDEFGQYVTDSVGKMLDQIRKKKVFLRLAHQHLSQLENQHIGEKLVESIHTNCRNKVVFGGLATHDAKAMTELLHMGFVDLHEVHSELKTTKIRTEESTRTVTSKSQGQSEGESESHGTSHNYTEGETESQTLGTSTSSSKSHSESDAEGESQSTTNSRSFTKGGSVSTGHGNSQGGSRTESNGESITRSFSNTTSNSHGYTESQGESISDSESSSESHNSSSNDSSGSTLVPRLNPDGTVAYMENISHSFGNSASSNSGSSQSHTKSQNLNRGTSESHGTASQEGVAYGSSGTQTEGENWSNTTNQTRSQNQSQQQGQSVGRGTNRSHSVSHGITEGEGESESNTRGVSRTQGQGENQSSSQSKGTSESYSESTVPYDEKIPYQEVTSRRYYTHQEQMARTQGKLMNLSNANCMIKLTNNAPQAVQIRHVKSVGSSQKISQSRIGRLKTRIYDSHKDYYNDRETVLLEAENRQRQFFDRPLMFNEIKYVEAEIVPESEPSDSDENVFNI